MKEEALKLADWAVRMGTTELEEKLSTMIVKLVDELEYYQKHYLDLASAHQDLLLQELPDFKPLSDEEINEVINSCVLEASAWHGPDLDIHEFARAIEEKHGIR